MNGTIEYAWRSAKSFKPGRGAYRRPVTIILHSTDGHEAGDVATLTEGPVSVHWYVTRAGKVYHFVADGDTAYHAGKVRRPEYSNTATLGIEQEHIDTREDWPDAQVQMVARIVAFERQKYGEIPVVSHADAAAPPGRKVDPVAYPWDRLHELVTEAMQTTWCAVSEG